MREKYTSLVVSFLFVFVFRCTEQAMVFGNQKTRSDLHRAQLQTMYQAKERELEEHATESRRRIQEMTGSNNNVHLSCAHQRPGRSHDTY